ncbi:hypothetical protein [Nonomuraea sp. NPDC003754]
MGDLVVLSHGQGPQLGFLIQQHPQPLGQPCHGHRVAQGSGQCGDDTTVHAALRAGRGNLVLPAAVDRLHDHVDQLADVQTLTQRRLGELGRQRLAVHAHPQPASQADQFPADDLPGQIDHQERLVGQYRGAVHGEQRLPTPQATAEHIQPLGGPCLGRAPLVGPRQPYRLGVVMLGLALHPSRMDAGVLVSMEALCLLHQPYSRVPLLIGRRPHEYPGQDRRERQHEEDDGCRGADPGNSGGAAAHQQQNQRDCPKELDGQACLLLVRHLCEMPLMKDMRRKRIRAWLRFPERLHE